jgi:hypothetical protein
MRNRFLRNPLVLSIVALIVFQSCKDDAFLAVDPPVANSSFVEEFDTASAALARGWVFRNTSDSMGGGVWQDGGEVNPWFQAFSNFGNKAGFIGVDYTSTMAQSVTISNWLISPPTWMQNGDKIVFYTRALNYPLGTTGDSTDYGNSLQVSINPLNDVVNVGPGLAMGNYVALYYLNPTLAHSSKTAPNANAYPSEWTRFEVTVRGLTKPVRGRFAFQYIVKNGGSNGNGSGIAIDQVTYTSISK